MPFQPHAITPSTDVPRKFSLPLQTSCWSTPDAAKLRNAVTQAGLGETQYIQPATNGRQPARLTKPWMLEKTIRRCSRAEHKHDTISPKSQSPLSSLGTVGVDTATPPGEQSGRS